ncbi:uncharacterized protein LOC62_02G003472 [Vanrija pseudolonga]|uniref:Uncharacterized protein n=1 Tax=Vanrija pseudolonga TaxID=143232 RepID=A0AAF0YAE5_9TREE|nr:hypothetical protein LOC62_02G003472 [Vanrija pseudolonga]
MSGILCTILDVGLRAILSLYDTAPTVTALTTTTTTITTIIAANTVTVTTTTTTGPNPPPHSAKRTNADNVQHLPSSLRHSVLLLGPRDLALDIKTLDKLRLVEQLFEMERVWKHGGRVALKTRLIPVIMSFSEWRGFPFPLKEMRLWNEQRTAHHTPPIEVFVHRLLRPFHRNDPDALWQLDYHRRAFACLVIFVFELLARDQYDEADVWEYPAMPLTNDIAVLFAAGRHETLVRIHHGKLYVALAHGLRELYLCDDEWDRDFEDTRSASILECINDRFENKDDPQSIAWGNLAARLALLLNSCKNHNCLGV